jgi:hypothetical protein
MIDRIVEGKRRKLLGLDSKKKKAYSGNGSSVQDQSQSKNDETGTDLVDREALLREELDKIKCIDENSTLVQTFTGDIFICSRNTMFLKYEVSDCPTLL